MTRPTFGTDPTWHRQEKYKRYHGDNGAKPRAKMAVVQALGTLNSTHGFVPVGMILKQDPALTRPSVHRVLLELEREACLVTRGQPFQQHIRQYCLGTIAHHQRLVVLPPDDLRSATEAERRLHYLHLELQG